MAEPAPSPRIRFTAHGKPAAWGRTKNRIMTSKKTGQQFVSSYTPARTVTEEGAVRYFCERAIGDMKPLEGALELIVRIFKPIPESWSKGKRAAALAGEIRPTDVPDWDNFGKLPSDALNGMAYVDDRQIVDGFVSLWYSDRPRTEISVRKVAEGPQTWKPGKRPAEEVLVAEVTAK